MVLSLGPGCDSAATSVEGNTGAPEIVAGAYHNRHLVGRRLMGEEAIREEVVDSQA